MIFGSTGEMKSFLFALLLLVLIFLGISLNSYFLNRKIAVLYEQMLDLSIDEAFSSEGNVSKIEILHEMWKSTKTWMCLSFRRDLIRDFDQSINSLESFAKGDLYGEFLNSLESGFDLLDEMEQNNSFDLSMFF